MKSRRYYNEIINNDLCIILCKLNLADDIYNTMAQNNRSLPWMNVCLFASVQHLDHSDEARLHKKIHRQKQVRIDVNEASDWIIEKQGGIPALCHTNMAA